MPRTLVRKLADKLSLPRIVRYPVSQPPTARVVKYRSSNTEFSYRAKARMLARDGKKYYIKQVALPTAQDPQSSVIGSSPAIPVTTDVDELRRWRSEVRSSGKRVGFVPTMGALHEGHLKLIRRAAIRNHEVCVSIYVNPTQFGVNEDLSSYPRTWDEDLKKLQILNEEMKSTGTQYMGRVTTIFHPSSKAMYPTLPPTSEIDGYGSFVHITPLSGVLEGASRPVFFRGVATVVMKLFNIVQPDQVFFGQKDIQQALVIRRMIKDFHIDTDMRVVETMRDNDGLALSSRNVYLGDRRRRVGLVLCKALLAGQERMETGNLKRSEILGAALEVAKKIQDEQRRLLPSQRARFEFDYLSLADPDTLQEIEVVDPEKGAIFSGAVIMLPLEDPHEGEDTGLGNGATSVRLIDNRVFYPLVVFGRSKGGERTILVDRTRSKVRKIAQELTGQESAPMHRSIVL